MLVRFSVMLLVGALCSAGQAIRLLYNNLGPQQTKEWTDMWLERAERAGFTAVAYPIGVFRRPYTPSKRPLPGFDPIQYFITEAHSRGMLVFAWWAGFFREEFAKEHGFTIPVDSKGKTPNLYYGYCLNDPKFREAIRGFLEEFLSAYDFDAISYDDGYGFPRGDTCYCKNCLEKFKELYAGDPAMLRKGPQKFTKVELADYRKLLSSWEQFRVDSVCDFAKFVRDTARKIKPGIIVSTSGSARPDRWRFYDKVQCLKKGLIDFYEPELYFSTNDAGKRMKAGLEQWRKSLGADNSTKLIPIIYAWLRQKVGKEYVKFSKTGSQLIPELEAVESFGPNLAFFDDRGLTDEIIATLARGKPPTEKVPACLKRTPGKFNIMISGFINDDHYGVFLDLFREKGAVVKYYSGYYNRELLSNFDLLFELPVRVFTDDEAEALRAFVTDGGRVFFMGGDYQNKCRRANSFLKDVGLLFGDPCGSPVFEPTVKHPLIEGITKVHALGGTGIKVSPPGVPLLKSGDTVGLAVSLSGKGKVLLFCDEWAFASFGKKSENIFSEQYDHRKLAENIIRWLIE